MNYHEANKIIDKSHFKTFAKVKPLLKKKYPTVTDKEIRKLLKTRIKDNHIFKYRKVPYMIKIFSSSPNCWFHDLLDNKHTNNDDTTPRYWHIFIGVNNRYAYALPLKNKSSKEVNGSLTTSQGYMWVL
jgi:hypothetical protein